MNSFIVFLSILTEHIVKDFKRIHASAAQIFFKSLNETC